MRKVLCIFIFIVGSSLFLQEPEIQDEQDSSSTQEDAKISLLNCYNKVLES
jgi:hypothetical protein